LNILSELRHETLKCFHEGAARKKIIKETEKRNLLDENTLQNVMMDYRP